MSHPISHNAISSENIKNFCFLSISYLEKSLACLINIQAEEIRLINDNNNIKYNIELTNEVRRSLTNLSRLHILLLYKLEFIIKSYITEENESSLFTKKQTTNLCPQKHSTYDICTNYSDKLHISKKNDNDSNFAKLNKCRCLGRCKSKCFGRCLGIVTSVCDAFNGGIAIVQTCVGDTKSDETDQEFFCYSVMKQTKMQILSAFPSGLNLKIQKSSNGITTKIEGLGSIIIKERSHSDKNDIGSFIFTVYYDNDPEKSFFEMQIQAKNNPDYNHSSGKIYSKCSELLLQM